MQQKIDASLAKSNPIKAIHQMIATMALQGNGEKSFKGRQRPFKTAKGTKLNSHFELVEIDDLIVSHTLSGKQNSNYPQELQPRDRERDSSQAWIQKTSKAIDPESLGNTSRADTGAPIVGTDMVVESGNGRTMALLMAYQNGDADEYISWLKSEADYFGFSKEQVSAFKKPILVRVRDSEIDRVQFAIEANQDDKLSYTATERAKSDAKRIDERVLMLFDPSDNGDLMALSNRKFLDAFMSSLGETESAQYRDKQGNYTQAFVTRVKQAIFAKAYNDDRLLEMMADQSRPEMQNLINALTISSSKFIDAQSISAGNVEDIASSIVDGIEVSLNDQLLNSILDATNAIAKARQNNQSITEYVKQQGLFEELPEEVAKIAVFIVENNRSAKKLSYFFNSLASFSKKQALDSQNFGLFGEPEPISILVAVNYALDDFESNHNLQKSMFDAMNTSINTIVNKSNVIHTLDYIYSELIVSFIKEINENDLSIYIENNSKTTSLFDRILSGRTQINYETVKACLKLAQNEQAKFSQVATFIFNEIYDNSHDENLKNYLSKMAKANDLEKLESSISCLAYEQCLVEHTTTKGKILNGFSLDQKGLKRSEIIKYDQYTFFKNGWYVRLNNISTLPENYLNDIQIHAKRVIDYVSNPNNDVEPTSAIYSGSRDPSDFEQDTIRVRSLAGTTKPNIKTGESNGYSDTGVSNVSDASISSGRDRTNESELINLRSSDSANERNNGIESRINGLPIEQERDQRVIHAVQEHRSLIESNLQAQLDADEETTEFANIESINKALPYLMDEQKDDVLKAEKHIIENKKNGILFTNGTGTGKTFTGLGVAKRFINAGKKKILFVTLNDKIAKDFIKSAKALNINIHQLDSTKDNGHDQSNIIITTYANFSQNESLTHKDWDLIIIDEAHALMQNSKGEKTSSLEMLHALTGHHQGFYKWVESRYADQKPIADEDGNVDKEQLNTWNNLIEPLKKEWAENWKNQSQNRAKVVFLSATPFSYDKTLDWAEGYLFHYSDPEKTDLSLDGYGYNKASDKQNFYIQNFGYRMRYNKLTRPDGKVNISVQERQLAEKLKKSGAMTGRDLNIKFDYDRKFVLISSKVGQLIDEGLEYLSDSKDAKGDRKFPDLSRAIAKRFDYLSRRRLLESIKAKEGIPFIKKNLSLNRKVIIFHDYNEGGGFSPFVKASSNAIDHNELSRLDAQFSVFQTERPDLVNLNLNYNSPITTLRTAFPNALLFNGRVSKKQRQQNIDLFNNDELDHHILVVQSDAGSTGISLHDVTGKYQRVNINIGQPIKPAKLRQTEGRIYRVGQSSNAIQRYFTTGTNWERSAFAETIAGRAETVDNLSKGDDALVSIKEAIIHAYENADTYEPSEQDGIGGKAYDEENANLKKLSPFDQSISFYWAKGQNKQNRNNREGVEWYATPEPLGFKMIEWAGVHTGDDVLEPSAGDGAIGRFVPDDTNLTMIEPTESLAGRAKMANTNANVIEDYFENLNTINKYHAIVMNPPFGNAGATAIKHIEKAFHHLHDGGRIVALIPKGSMDKKIDKFLEYTSTAYLLASIDLPNSVFKNAGTTVLTRIVIIEKHENSDDAQYSKNIDLSNRESVTDFFESIKHLEVQKRKPRLDETFDYYGLYVDIDRGKYIYTGEGIKNPIIQELFQSYYADNSIDGQFVLSYNRNKDIIKKIKAYEKEHNVSLKVEKVDTSYF